MKLSSTNKITKILDGQKQDIFKEIKEFKMTSLQLKSKMVLGMKSNGVDPQVKQILADCLNKLTKLQQDRD